VAKYQQLTDDNTLSGSFGFDFGLSYAANGSEGENYYRPNAASNVTGPFQRDPNATIRNEISGAIRYRGSFGNVGVAAALSAQRADAPANNGFVGPNGFVVGQQNPTAYQAGVNLSAFGFTLGGHYLWGKYAGDSFGRAPIRDGLSNSTNWTVGLTYVVGAFQVGAFYSKATRDNGPTLNERRQQVMGVGAVYTLAPGLEMFANYTNIQNDNIANSAGNPTAYAAQRNRDLDVIIIGTRLAF
jgi:predicted porin